MIAAEATSSTASASAAIISSAASFSFSASGLIKSGSRDFFFGAIGPVILGIGGISESDFFVSQESTWSKDNYGFKQWVAKTPMALLGSQVPTLLSVQNTSLEATKVWQEITLPTFQQSSLPSTRELKVLPTLQGLNERKREENEKTKLT